MTSSSEEEEVGRAKRDRAVLGGGVDPVGTLAVRSNTDRSYRQLPQNFVQWCGLHHLRWKTHEELDLVLAQYSSDHYLTRAACNIGSQTMAAIAHVASAMFKKSVPILPRASGAAAAWRRRAPGRTRLPVPRVAAAPAVADAGRTAPGHCSRVVAAELRAAGHRIAVQGRV
ncbi:unnamed protein product [Prorocentrum cordatum]|uniref:Uncharacterized protein n=1 Tax=Prorocentrum cordatum TaxID=2364126 RepID=A0ABN9R4J0_9DINO|nr:unnamed protein product [Polarella glacialis]